MIKATLTPKHARPKKQEIELPDTADTGDIISVIANAMRNFDYEDCIDADIFVIALEDGTVYRCYQFANICQYRLYLEEPGSDDYKWLADFKC